MVPDQFSALVNGMRGGAGDSLQASVIGGFLASKVLMVSGGAGWKRNVADHFRGSLG